MEKEVQRGQQNIKYYVRVSKRARQMRLEIRRNGEVLVTMPQGTQYGLVEKFITEKSQWITEKIEYVTSVRDKIFLNGNKREFLRYKEQARLLAKTRIAHYNNIYHFKVNKVAIKNQRSRWGSCSKKGNLNFNYKIALLPENLADYVIVHELCHLGEFNHSKKFWQLVSLAIPNYKELKGKFYA